MQRIVLVGGGHAHLALLESAAQFKRAGCELTLIDDDDLFHYSGMATGLVGGRYRQDELTVDLDQLCRQLGVIRIRGRVSRIDRQQRQVQLDSGQHQRYDYLSLNVGSMIDWPAGPLPDHVFPIKPIGQLQQLRARIETWPRARPLRLLVVGGGVTGCEIAANLSVLIKQCALRGSIELVHAAQEVARELPATARRYLAKELTADGITLSLGQRVAADSDFRLSSVTKRGEGDTAPDLVVLAPGLIAPPLVRGLGLAASNRGLVVSAQLQSSDPRLFAVGDCADIAGFSLPKVGVYGVRAASTLQQNLLAISRGEPLAAYRPQQRYLSILNLGGGHGLACRGRLWAAGRWAMRLKDRIDRRFIAQYSI